MSLKANYFKLGMFILTGTVLGLAALLALSAGLFRQHRAVVETYLNESVQGLDLGSKVMYRGVLVGRVRHIGFTSAKYQTQEPPEKRRPYVLIEAEIDPQAMLGAKGSELTSFLGQEVKRGLRFRMASLGVTGTSYLELDYVTAEATTPLAIDWTPSQTYVPSTTSTVNRIINFTEGFFKRLQNLDVETLLKDLSTAAVSVSRKIDKLPVEEVGTNLTALVREIRDTNLRVQDILHQPAIDALPTEAAGAMRGLRLLMESPEVQRVVTQFDHTLDRLDRMLAGKEGEISSLVENLRLMAENLRDLSETTKHYPSQLFFGSPPARILQQDHKP